MEEIVEEIAEEAEEQKPYVWHDETHYRRLWKRAAAIAAVAVLAGLLPYLLWWRNYTDGAEVSLGVFAIVLVALVVFFSNRLVDNLATYVSFEGELYRLTDANRALTRIALDNSREYPDFQRDFERACRGNTSWCILEVEQLKEIRKGYEISCRVRLSKSGKERKKDFYLEEGYQDMELLLGELRQLKKTT